jgi:hypothetical protein
LLNGFFESHFFIVMGTMNILYGHFILPFYKSSQDSTDIQYQIPSFPPFIKGKDSPL